LELAAKSNVTTHRLRPAPESSSNPESTRNPGPISMALEVTQVRKSYAGNEALRGVSFGIRAGQRLALLGPNGAGKTTLIRCISGRVEVSAGEVKLFGKRLGQPNATAQLGVVPQELAIYPDLTARENLECFARLHGLRGRKLHDRVDWALHWIGLQDRASELTAKFSGGMKRRVNIACGVMHAPGLLLLDEPTVGVDPQSRQRIFDMLDELNGVGTTILLTTHHLDEAEQRSDRIVIIDHGQVIADGTIDELLDQTIGKEKRVTLEVEGTVTKLPDGLVFQPQTGRIVGACQNLVDELPLWMESLARTGVRIKNLEMQTPNLHHVFLHLTGRELRE
jgi:ABC-2 type transport system ATP-binding protein